MQNIMTNAMSNVIGAWWRIADHTTGDETGRMMVVNGFDPGAIFFRSTVPVTPNTFFLFSTWILNLFKVTGFPPAELGVRILDQNNNVIFQQTLGVEIPVNVNEPEWKQVGTVINSLGNTQLTVEFFSEGVGVVGNDYVIDDIALQPITVPTFIPVKSVSTTTANVGDIVTYTVQLTNKCTSPLINPFFRDPVPIGLEFIHGTVTVNGSTEAGADPNIGFDLPDIPGGTTTTITFQVRVEGVPLQNPAINVATIDYSYTPVEGGIPLDFSEDSNPVPLLIVEVPAEAENVILTDNISPSIAGAEFSVDGGVTFNPWPGTLNIGTLIAGASRTILIRGTVNQTAKGCIANAANVTSTTPDLNLLNNTSSICVEVKKSADVKVKKKCKVLQQKLKNIVIFKIKVTNLGPSTAIDVILEDKIPNGIVDVKFSINGSTEFEPWTGSLNLGNLEAGQSIIVILEGILKANSKKKICNTAKVSSATSDPDLTNNTSSVAIKATGYNNRRGCCENFECFECDRCTEFMEDNNREWMRDDF